MTIALCETDPGQGFCLQPPGPSVTTQIDGGQTPTFGIFVTGTGTVSFDPASNRIFVRFKDRGRRDAGLDERGREDTVIMSWLLTPIRK